MPKIRDLQGGQYLSVRINDRQHRTLVELLRDGLAYDPSYSKSDAVRDLLDVAGKQERDAVALQASLREAQRREREARHRAEETARQLEAAKTRQKKRDKAQDVMTRRVHVAWRHIDTVRQLAARGAPTPSRVPILDELWRNLSKDWRRVLAVMEDVGPPGGAA